MKINWYELSENLHFETWAKKYLQFFETIPESVEIFFFSQKKGTGASLIKSFETQTQQFSKKLENCPTLVET